METFKPKIITHHRRQEAQINHKCTFAFPPCKSCLKKKPYRNICCKVKCFQKKKHIKSTFSHWVDLQTQKKALNLILLELSPHPVKSGTSLHPPIPPTLNTPPHCVHSHKTVPLDPTKYNSRLPPSTTLPQTHPPATLPQHSVPHPPKPSFPPVPHQLPTPEWWDPSPPTLIWREKSRPPPLLTTRTFNSTPITQQSPPQPVRRRLHCVGALTDTPQKHSAAGYYLH